MCEHCGYADCEDDDPEARIAECEECGGEYDTKTGYGCSCNGG